MTTQDPPTPVPRYGAWLIGLHWLMLLLIAGAYASMELRGIFPRGSAVREVMKTWHYTLGLGVLALVVLRVLVRLRGETPAIVPPPPAWQRRSASWMHLALYAFMLGMPVAGWFTLSAQGHAIPFFGLQLPPLMAQSDAAAKWIKDVHETVASIGYVLIGLHAAAALFHHYLVRDNTLRRMLPIRR